MGQLKVSCSSLMCLSAGFASLPHPPQPRFGELGVTVSVLEGKGMALLTQLCGTSAWAWCVCVDMVHSGLW